ncbi:hypothetical protein JZO70_07760 [Enterococcus sp. 669A]|uniref:Core-binding (CB) domain-containing protein n=1 Tax=Candidatus Enterococcus moelleringii TaxID=2815325 RepID=A0ABS3L8V6_9ENTE|nr:hypothetical protein [Enterococcus sp. 669A]
MKNISNEELIQLVQKRAAELGRAPGSAEFKKATIACNRFGSWTNFLKEAGLILQLDKQTLIDELLKLSKELGETPRMNEFKYRNEAINQFGLWTTFIDESGLKRRSNVRISNQVYLREVQQKAAELGRIPKSSDVDNPFEIIRRFKSWDNFLEAAGLIPSKKVSKKDLSKESIIREFIELSEQLGETPRVKEFPYQTQAVKKFGSWTNFVKATGLPPRKKGYSREELIQAVKEKTAELDRVPTEDEFKLSGHATLKFKTWKAFLKQAGLESK